MKVNLPAITIGTRDGTLAKDSKVVNALEGQKRPGLVTVATLPAGAAQGMIQSPTLGALVIIANNIYSVTTGLLVAAIPFGVGPYDVVAATPAGLIAFKDSLSIWTLVGNVVTKVPNGVSGATVTSPGSGGVNGVWPLTIGGPGTGAAGTYTISGGQLTAVSITAPGDGYTTPPLLSFPNALTQVTAATYGGYATGLTFEPAQKKVFAPLNYPVGGYPTTTQGICAVLSTNPAVGPIFGTTIGPQAPYLLGYLPMPAGQPYAHSSYPVVYNGFLYTLNPSYTSINCYSLTVPVESVPTLAYSVSLGINMSTTLVCTAQYLSTSFNNVITSFYIPNLPATPIASFTATVTTPVTPNFQSVAVAKDSVHTFWGAANGVWVMSGTLAQTAYISVAAGAMQSMAVSGNFLFVANVSGCFVYNMSVLTAPVLATTITGTFNSASISDNLLILGDNTGTITYVYDITTPTAPVLRSSATVSPTPNHANTFTVIDNGYVHMTGPTSFTVDYLTTMQIGNGGTAVATVSSAPTSMLPGFVALDNTWYVMTTDNKIHGSTLGDVTSWDPLNMLVVNADMGPGVAIARQLNYLAAFADAYTILYYDAGNPPPGSPLSPAQNTYIDVGCASAGSITEIAGQTIFMGKSEQRGRSIYTLQGTQIQVISDEIVDKILGQSTLASVSSYALKIFGRSLYVLTLRDLGVSLVLNLNSKHWDVWTSSTTAAPDPIVANSYNQSYFAPSYYLNGGGRDLLLHESNGKVYQMLPAVYQDDGLPIDVNFVTQILEGDNSDLQRIAAAELVGDKVNSTAYVRYSDDDYTTWSTYQTVPLLNSRSQAVRQGATRRRSYQIRHTDNVALNLRTLALELVPK